MYRKSKKATIASTYAELDFEQEPILGGRILLKIRILEPLIKNNF